VICPGCGAELARLSAGGEPMIRARGLIMKADHVAAICPKCAADVPLTRDDAKALAARLLLVFRGPRAVVTGD
jgi:hypothetical protein